MSVNGKPIARFVCDIRDVSYDRLVGHHLRLYYLEGKGYVVVAMLTGRTSETLIFEANEHGDITNFLELPGSYVGGADFEQALENAGYCVVTRGDIDEDIKALVSAFGVELT